jgi:nucleoside-diphosphate-sugar epimerase
MDVIISGYSGFVGSHLLKVLKKKNSVVKLNLRNFKNLEKKKIINFLNKNCKKDTILINCASSLNPKTKQDFFLNAKLPEIFFDFTKKNNLKFIHISTINTLIKERKDDYTISKKKGEIKINEQNCSIIRLPLIVKKKGDIYLQEGQLKKFFLYLKFFKLPIYPFIYPGALYRPIDIDDICRKIILLLKKKKCGNINIQGKKIMSSFELFKIICNQNNKYCLKIPTSWLKKIIPNPIKNILYRNNFFQQILNVKNYI